MHERGVEEVSTVFHVLWRYVASARPSKYPAVVVLYITSSNQVHILWLMTGVLISLYCTALNGLSDQCTSYTITLPPLSPAKRTTIPPQQSTQPR